MIERVHVKGQNRGDIMLYALSTCVWCKKARTLLDDLGVEYHYIYVDELTGNDRESAVKEVTAYNPKCSFPTIVVNGEQCIVGSDEDKIREAIGL